MIGLYFKTQGKECDRAHGCGNELQLHRSAVRYLQHRCTPWDGVQSVTCNNSTECVAFDLLDEDAAELLVTTNISHLTPL